MTTVKIEIRKLTFRALALHRILSDSLVIEGTNMGNFLRHELFSHLQDMHGGH